MSIESKEFRVVISGKNGVDPSLTTFQLNLQQFSDLVPYGTSNKVYTEVCVESFYLTYFKASGNNNSLGCNVISINMNPPTESTVDSMNNYNSSTILQMVPVQTTEYTSTSTLGVLQYARYQSQNNCWTEVVDRSFSSPMTISILNSKKGILLCTPDEVFIVLRFRFEMK